jgi:hypothetical protein
MKSVALAGCMAVLCFFSSRQMHAQSIFDAESLVHSPVNQLPLNFEPNRGQTDPKYTFVSRAASYTVLLGPAHAEILLTPDEHRAIPAHVSIELVDASSAAQGDTLNRLPGVSNYYLGKSPADWHTGVPQYARVAFRSVYPGIDLVYYGTQGELESDFVLSPGANPKRIAFRVSGIDRMQLTASGNLLMQLPAGSLELKKPTIYQNLDGGRHTIAGNFVIRGKNEVGLALGDYDSTQPLVIDPALSYSTLIGANNSTTAQAVLPS